MTLTERDRIPRSLPGLEIAEESFARGGDRVRDALSRFRDLGYFIWMDDVAGGGPSLAVLKDFGFDLIKLHESFPRSLDGRGRAGRAEVFLRSTVSMARRLSMLTVAEGVETAGQLELLGNAGCGFARGPRIAQPKPLDAILKLDVRP